MANTQKFTGILDLVALTKEPAKYSQSILSFAQKYMNKLIASESWGTEHTDKKFLAASQYFCNLYSVGEMLYTTASMPKRKLDIYENVISTWYEGMQNPTIINALWDMSVRCVDTPYHKNILILLKILDGNNEKFKDFEFSCADVKSSVFELSVQFNENLKTAKESFYISTDDVKELDGLSKEFKAQGREYSKENSLQERYAYLLTDYNVETILKNCKSRAFRKLAYLKSRNMATYGEYNNEEVAKKLIMQNYDASSFSSVVKSVLAESNIESYELNTFFNTAKNTIFISHSEMQNEKAIFAKNKLNIPVIRAWDEKFVDENYYSQILGKDCKYLTFNSQLAWEKIKAKIESVFGVKIKEKSNDEKIYINDKFWKVYSGRKLIGEIYISTEKRDAKEDLIYCTSFVDADYFEKGQVPFNFINLNLAAGAKFEDLADLFVTFHELGHAMQFIFRDSEDSYGQHLPRNFNEGMESCLIEFPSQWFEDFALTEDFLTGVLKANRCLATSEQVCRVIDVYKLKDSSLDWSLLFNSKLDWIIHKNKQLLRYDLEDKVTALQKEFGVHCVRGRNAVTSLNNFKFFHMGGKYFSYLFTKSLVRTFNQVLKGKSDEEKGRLLREWYKMGSQSGLIDTFRQVGNIFIYK